jgi:DNA-binding NtrC family response regulator
MTTRLHEQLMPRILIVDDSPEWRGILGIALGTIPGAEVLSAESAEQAFALSESKNIDVLVTDFRMEGISGLDLLNRVREHRRWPVCGAVVISGETDPDLPARAVAEGAAAYFEKPFSPAAIRKCVLSLLNHGVA